MRPSPCTTQTGGQWNSEVERARDSREKHAQSNRSFLAEESVCCARRYDATSACCTRAAPLSVLSSCCSAHTQTHTRAHTHRHNKQQHARRRLRTCCVLCTALDQTMRASSGPHHRKLLQKLAIAHVKRYNHAHIPCRTSRSRQTGSPSPPAPPRHNSAKLPLSKTGNNGGQSNQPIHAWDTGHSMGRTWWLVANRLDSVSSPNAEVANAEVA